MRRGGREWCLVLCGLLLGSRRLVRGLVIWDKGGKGDEGGGRRGTLMFVPVYGVVCIFGVFKVMARHCGGGRDLNSRNSSLFLSED